MNPLIQFKKAQPKSAFFEPKKGLSPPQKDLCSIGAIDLHFHGAFGIDLMSATVPELNELSLQLWKSGIAGFCPTTISAPFPLLARSVQQLGKWIRSETSPGAKPLGIHLEGPFINSLSCGSHPLDAIRPLDWDELNQLWELSKKTLKILTIAPELLDLRQLKNLVRWCLDRKVHLSLGHSQASEAQARAAFEHGVQGVTHCWNALAFHHRNPGVLGAALGRSGLYIELIIDQVHVSPTIIRWTRSLHERRSIYFVSDCLASGGSFTRSKSARTDAVRMADGRIAGGKLLLTQSYPLWVAQEARNQQSEIRKMLQLTLGHITQIPLKLLGIPGSYLRHRQVLWKIGPSQKNPAGIHVIPIDSSSGTG